MEKRPGSNIEMELNVTSLAVPFLVGNHCRNIDVVVSKFQSFQSYCLGRK